MKFFSKNPAAWAGLIQASVALLAAFKKDIPVEAILAFIAAATGLSFKAQTIEHEKTDAAYWSDPEDPDDDN